MKLPFFLKTAAHSQTFRKRFMYVWIKRYKLIFIILFLTCAGVSAFQWYWSLDKYAWSSDQKQAYLQKTVTATSFQESRFQDTLKALEMLHQAHLSPVPAVRDVFQGKQKTTP